MAPLEKTLARVMSYLAEKFPNELVLKGGMLLRILASPRETNDIDYGWIRKKRRGLFANEVKKKLEELEGVSVRDIQENSRGVFIECQEDENRAIFKIEINVVEEFNLPPEPRTTASLSIQYSLRPSIIPTMALAENFSHKIAAAIERSQLRDLYDISQLEPLTPFDEKTLLERFKKLSINQAKPKAYTSKQAADLLKNVLDFVTMEKIIEELGGVLPKEYLPGLDMVIKNTVNRVIQRIKNLS